MTDLQREQHEHNLMTLLHEVWQTKDNAEAKVSRLCSDFGVIQM